MQDGGMQDTCPRPACACTADWRFAQVPLISLGALCARHWRDKELNPSGIEVVSREYRHEPENRNIFDIRSGPACGGLSELQCW